MRLKAFMLTTVVGSAVNASELHLDMLQAKGDPDKTHVVLSYRGCVDVLTVTKADIAQENSMDESDLKEKGPITKWLISQKKIRDGQKYDCKK